MSTKVKFNFKLIGTSYKIMKSSGETNYIYKAEIETKDQFGDRPLYNKNADKIETKYQKYYASGWLVCDKCIDGSDGGSELVVLAHGDSMELANKNLLKCIPNIEWEKYAKDFK